MNFKLKVQECCQSPLMQFIWLHMIDNHETLRLKGRIGSQVNTEILEENVLQILKQYVSNLTDTTEIKERSHVHLGDK